MKGLNDDVLRRELWTDTVRDLDFSLRDELNDAIDIKLSDSMWNGLFLSLRAELIDRFRGPRDSDWKWNGRTLR